MSGRNRGHGNRAEDQTSDEDRWLQKTGPDSIMRAEGQIARGRMMGAHATSLTSNPQMLAIPSAKARLQVPTRRPAMKTIGDVGSPKAGTHDELLEKRSFLWRPPGYVVNFLPRNYELEYAQSSGRCVKVT
jgi:hypothetical protein